MVTVQATLERARSLLDLRRPVEAARELRGAITHDPQHPTAHALLAVALIEQGEVAEAAAEADEAVRLAPDFWFTHYTAGQVYYRAHRPDRALPAVEASLALAPEHANTWELLARVRVQSDQWAEAAQAARQGLRIDPQDSDLVSLLAVALVMLGDAAEARPAAALAVRLNPESATAHLVYGRAELAFGDPRRAAEAFREVLRLDPSFDHARDLLVLALKRRNPLYRVLTRLRGRFRGGRRMALLLPMAPPLIAVFVLIAVLHWAAWVAESWATLRLHRGRTTRLLLEGAQARVAVLCCVLPVAGALLLASGVASGLEAVGTAGAAVMALVTPVQEAAHTGSRRGRSVLYGWAALLALAIVTSLVLAASPATAGTGVTVALLSAYAALATIWGATAVRGATG
ncbi:MULTISPECIES: tetratricopeptide repeat protein [Streptosporangium]|uniref:Zn-dependent protease n=1 Tax=Streptosporangium brasiliense TaxID=47480 RepID=A0ABT9R6V4_9ACTN|nr:tetratricopeptide repeat protein [Streptosporangium brasiliense]MDP9864130.1 putative Zn-dependent protease [Streptosporangium brasiliense]